MNINILNEKEVVLSNMVVQPNSIVYGDCMKIMKYIPNNSIDMVLVDPPYG